jgi:hypothetical protein
MASGPYASVILPVHKRSLSLFASLQSVRSQSIEDIEIIVAGDGVTEDVAKSVEAFTRRDHRIRFLNQEKAPGRGERNRDRAVRAARSDRIFYIDDDDLWLPNHIQVLSRYLDDLDVVNTPIWSVQPSGVLAMLPGNYGSRTLRRLLAQRALKLVHDTHLAHRRSTYLGLNGGGWVEDTEGRPVLRLLSQFAEDESIAWGSIPDVTALSFSSPPRWRYSEAERLVELMDWLPRTQSPQAPVSLPPTASLAHFLLEVALQLPPSGTQDLLEYLAGFDIRLTVEGHTRNQDSTGPILTLNLTPTQLRHASAVMELLQGSARDENVITEIVLDVAESPHGKESMAWHVCNYLTAALDIDDAIQIVRTIRAIGARREALRNLLLAQLYFKNEEQQKAVEYLSTAADHSQDFTLEYQALRHQMSAIRSANGKTSQRKSNGIHGRET